MARPNQTTRLQWLAQGLGLSCRISWDGQRWLAIQNGQATVLGANATEAQSKLEALCGQSQRS